jgi:hypothetical protein
MLPSVATESEQTNYNMKEKLEAEPFQISSFNLAIEVAAANSLGVLNCLRRAMSTSKVFDAELSTHQVVVKCSHPIFKYC